MEPETEEILRWGQFFSFSVCSLIVVFFGSFFFFSRVCFLSSSFFLGGGGARRTGSVGRFLWFVFWEGHLFGPFSLSLFSGFDIVALVVWFLA